VKRLDPLLEEALAAAFMMTIVGVFVAAFYWALTGLSPWPYVILCEVSAFGFGIVLLALVSPRRSR
jgi:uncharacterized RDD family membrane protein YckC